MTNEGMFRVNIIAAPPDGYPRTPDGLIDAMMGKLQASGIPLLTAASMVDLDLRIREAWDMPERTNRPLAVQVLGHATSGQLFLGSNWMTRPDGTTPPEVFRAPYYVLTTNPSALGFLYKHTGKLGKLDLVGCNVGAAWNDGGYAFNGRTLTYTLCELLRTDVTGAVDLVGPDELSTGVYVAGGPPPEGWSYNAGSPTRIGGKELTSQQQRYSYNGNPAKFAITQITNAQLPVQNPTFPKHTHIALDAVPLENEPRLQFASKELLVTLEAGPDGKPAVAAMFGNARFLMIDSAVYAVRNSAAVSQQLTELLWNR